MIDIETLRKISDAVDSGETTKVVGLIGNSESLLHFMTPFGTWLHVAAKRGKIEIVRELLRMGADINRRGGTFGGSALNLAAGQGHLDVIEYLIQQGASLDVDEPERNPLFSAVFGGHLTSVKLLIEKGIDPSVSYTGPYMKDMDALAFARERGQKEIANYLVSLQR